MIDQQSKHGTDEPAGTTLPRIAQRVMHGGPRMIPSIFITRFLGAQSTLARYEVAEEPGRPTAAVVFMTTKNLAALRDHSNTGWYHAPQPINYYPAGSDIAPARLSAGIARQQDKGLKKADELVAQRAAAIVRPVVAAGGPKSVG